MLRYPLALLGCLATALLGVSEARAGFAVSPMKQTVTVAPGKDSNFTIVVSNVLRSAQDKALQLRAEPVDFSVSLEGALLFGPEQQGPRSATGWITLDQSEIRLEPGESKNIQGKIVAPYHADGDYWSAVMVTLVTSKQKTGVNIVLRTACGLFVRVARRNYVQRLSISRSSVILPGETPASPVNAGQGKAGDAATTQSLVVQADDTDLGEFDALAPKIADAAATYDAATSQALVAQADVRNLSEIGGVVAGTATIYSANRRRVASMPMHTNRSHLLPGDIRRFVGVMASPLPPADYFMRMNFQSAEGSGQRAFKETSFKVAQDVARRWKTQVGNPSAPALQAQPERLQQNLTAGRFTCVSFSISNASHSTSKIHCSLNGVPRLVEWFRIESPDLTLFPSARHAVACRINVPKDAPPGVYEGMVEVNSESAGLIGQDNTGQIKVPVTITVTR